MANHAATDWEASGQSEATSSASVSGELIGAMNDSSSIATHSLDGADSATGEVNDEPSGSDANEIDLTSLDAQQREALAALEAAYAGDEVSDSDPLDDWPTAEQITPDPSVDDPEDRSSSKRDKLKSFFSFGRLTKFFQKKP